MHIKLPGSELARSEGVCGREFAWRASFPGAHSRQLYEATYKAARPEKNGASALQLTVWNILGNLHNCVKLHWLFNVISIEICEAKSNNVLCTVWWQLLRFKLRRWSLLNIIKLRLSEQIIRTIYYIHFFRILILYYYQILLAHYPKIFIIYDCK